MTSVNKWYLIVEVSTATAIEGGLFAHPWDEARVFTFGDTPPVDAGATISAEVEFIGGPTGGEFRLIRLLDVPTDVGETEIGGSGGGDVDLPGSTDEASD
jgi:hypothetical protein